MGELACCLRPSSSVIWCCLCMKVDHLSSYDLQTRNFHNLTATKSGCWTNMFSIRSEKTSIDRFGGSEFGFQDMRRWNARKKMRLQLFLSKSKGHGMSMRTHTSLAAKLKQPFVRIEIRFETKFNRGEELEETRREMEKKCAVTCGHGMNWDLTQLRPRMQ